MNTSLRYLLLTCSPRLHVYTPPPVQLLPHHLTVLLKSPRCPAHLVCMYILHRLFSYLLFYRVQLFYQFIDLQTQKTEHHHLSCPPLPSIALNRIRVLQAQYLRTVLFKGNQYLSTALVKYPEPERDKLHLAGSAQHTNDTTEDTAQHSTA
jgi:hypothetical protein